MFYRQRGHGSGKGDHLYYVLSTAGSRFWQGGSFEVKKSTEDGDVEKESLEVTVPSKLEGMAYIQVEVRHVPGKHPIS